jgi:hypothetical protein
VADHHGGERDTSGQPGETEIHLPAPTLAPPIVGLGVTILTFGILFGLPVVIVGALLMAGGIALWLINDAREFVKAGEHGGHH